MTCEIRVSIEHDNFNDTSFYLSGFSNSSLDQAGALVAIVARKALTGQFPIETNIHGEDMEPDKYIILEDVIDWLDSCPNWDFAPELANGEGDSAAYYYHLEIGGNGPDGKPVISIGYAPYGLAIQYMSVGVFIKTVNRIRREINFIFSDCTFPSMATSYKPFKMLKLPS